MVKKGEYIDFAIELEKKTIDSYDDIKDNEISVGTEMSIILEIVVKIKELEERLTKLEGVR